MFVIDDNEEKDFLEFTSYTTASLLEKMHDFGDMSYDEVYGKLHGLYLDGKIAQEQFNILMFKGRDFLECFK